MHQVGSFEAKTHLAQLLRRVESGESIAITRHGKEIARLVPPQDTEAREDFAAAVFRWRRSRKGATLGKGLTIRKLIDEGRR